MSRPRRSQETKQRLLEAGVAAFLENGYHGTGLKEVLDRVKVPKGSFYNYFETKEDFGAQAIRYYSDCLAAKMGESLKNSKDPLKGLRKFFKTLMVEFDQSGYVGGCLVGNLGGELEGSDICRAELQTAFRRWRENVRIALQQSQDLGLVRKDLDAGEMADLLIEAWEGAVIRMKIDRSLKPLQRCLSRLFDDYFQP